MSNVAVGSALGASVRTLLIKASSCATNRVLLSCISFSINTVAGNQRVGS